MRFLLVLILVAGGVGLWYFKTNTQFRESFRGWRISDEDREKYEAYEKGKALFKASWEAAPDAQFESWGDDPLETAAPLDAQTVNGDIWIARGHVMITKDGQKLNEQWCLAFDRSKGTPVGRAVGKEAEETLGKVDSGELQKSMVKAVAKATPPPKATPAPGSWMWGKEGRSSLDQPATKAHAP